MPCELGILSPSRRLFSFPIPPSRCCRRLITMANGLAEGICVFYCYAGYKMKMKKNQKVPAVVVVVVVVVVVAVCHRLGGAGKVVVSWRQPVFVSLAAALSVMIEQLADR